MWRNANHLKIKQQKKKKKLSPFFGRIPNMYGLGWARRRQKNKSRRGGGGTTTGWIFSDLFQRR